MLLRHLGSVCLAATLGLTISLKPASAQSQVQSPVLDAAIAQETGIALKPGDRIRVTVVGFPELSGEQVVMTDGTLQLPLAGYVNVGGLTPNQATTQITEMLRPYVRRPQVGLAVVGMSPIQISVTGEVLRPGPRIVDPETFQNNISLTLSSVLSLAGGITPNADLRNITIRRAAPNGSKTYGVTSPDREITVNLWQAIQDGNLAADLPIHNGDEVIVPTAVSSYNDQQMLLSSTVAPAQIRVQVAGEVQDPGRIEVSPQSNVSSAVAAAGGLTEDSDDEEITLFRLTSDGRVEQQNYVFGESSEPLRDGDLIVVGRSTRSNIGGVFDFVGRVLNPFRIITDLFGGE